MSVTQKNQSSLDFGQTLKSSYNDNSGAFAVEGWVTGKVGRKITITASSATVDEVEFIENGVSLMTLEITYDGAAHDNVTIVERTA
jgi:hypothetical protein